MKILAVHPMAGDATNFYRIIGPLTHIARHNPEIQIIDGDKAEFSWQKVMQCDLMYMGRPSTMDALQIIKIAKRIKKPVIIDYDDNYVEIPKTNPRAESFADPARQLIIKDCMKEADVIITSTKSISDSIRAIIPNKWIEVIPNSYDPDMFYMPEKRNQQKIVLIRGGDTHANDMELHKQEIINCIIRYPEYKWAFMGAVPLWVTQNKDIPDSRLKLYEWTDLMVYYNMLMEMRPEILVVPLEDNLFNHGKSNCSWIEGTLSGAVTIGPKFLPEFNKPGVIHYENYHDIERAFDFAVSCNQDAHYAVAKEQIPCLREENRTRLNIIKSLVRAEFCFKPTVTDTSSLPRFNDKEFFDFALEHGWVTENETYKNGHYKTAEWLMEMCSPDAVIEFGCGPGAMIERFHQDHIYALGVELNDHYIDYYRQRNPNTSHLVIKGDISEGLEFPRKFDLGVSIEVFEHIDMPEEKWDALIKQMAENIKWFYFTSTPYRADEKHDFQWGHINIRRFEKWKELFEKNGWKFHSNPNRITAWDIVFKSELYK